MKTGAPFLFLLLIWSKAAFPLDSLCTGASATDYAYRESTGAKVDTVYRTFIPCANGSIITYHDARGMKSKTLCNDAFNIRSWHFEDKQYGYDVTAARIGDSIVINGTKGEKAFKKSLLVDSLPWYQPLEFSLLPFLISGRSECKFWMIRPTDMKAFTMIAHHKTIDSVQVNGRLEKAIKVTLSPHGIAGKFWRATYWYGVNDYSFLKNEAPGLFGASPMTIESIPHPGL